MAFLHLNFDKLKFRDLGHSDFSSFKVLGPTHCVRMKSPRSYRQTDGRTDRQTEIFFFLFCLLRHKKHEYLWNGENFFFHSCDYNTFSFYILGMWWESKNGDGAWLILQKILVKSIKFSFS